MDHRRHSATAFIAVTVIAPFVLFLAPARAEDAPSKQTTPAATNTPDAGRADKAPAFEIYDNYALISGSDRPANAGTPDLCQSACQADKDCKAFSFDKWNHICRLYPVAGTFRFEPKFATGIASGTAMPTNSEQTILTECAEGRRFSGLSAGHRDNVTLEDCDRNCSSDESCVAFNFDTSSKSCELYNSVSAIERQPDSVAGVKHQLVSDDNASAVKACKTSMLTVALDDSSDKLSALERNSLFAKHEACLLQAFEAGLKDAKSFDQHLVETATAQCEPVLQPLRKLILDRTDDPALADRALDRVRRASKRGLTLMLFTYLGRS